VLRAHLTQGRLLLGADRLGRRAARMEGAAGGALDGAGDVPGQAPAAVALGRVGLRDGGDQGLGVVVAWLADDGLAGSGLHDAPEVRHGGAPAHEGGHGQVMGDEQVGEAELVLAGAVVLRGALGV
jgi:hypothetical protein